MNILSYNVNGIRAAISKGLLDWAVPFDFDLLCFQEVKATVDQVDCSQLASTGYTYHWHSAEKKGYSGVAIFSKRKPDFVKIGLGIPKYDQEGRIIRMDFGDLTVLNCYFPSGTTGDIRQAVKMEFLADFFEFVNQLKIERPNLIIVGDYNIAHTEQDIHDPKGNKKSSGFLPDERAWLTNWFASGFVDSFRFKHPDAIEYSWWSARPGVRERNKGWRIDYIAVSQTLKARILDSGIYTQAIHSDHAPIWMQLADEQ